MTGVGRALKREIPSVLVVGVEPQESAVISGGEPGLHGIQGIGAGFVPSVLEMSILDEVISVSSDDAYRAIAALAACEGLLVGISSGAVAVAALEVARRLGEASRVVVLFPDTGERTRVFPDYGELDELAGSECETFGICCLGEVEQTRQSSRAFRTAWPIDQSGQ